ncbi:MAG: hypothetical protein WAT79_06300 [Saprospiraceae bacterium]
MKNTQKVSFTQEGKSGTVHYRGVDGSFDMYYEFGGLSPAVIIWIPTVEDWGTKTGISLYKRKSILSLIGEQIIFQQFKNENANYTIESKHIYIFTT